MSEISKKENSFFWAVLLAAVGIWFFSWCRYYLADGTAPLFWDSAAYFKKASEWISFPTLPSFRALDRPVFSWPTLLFFNYFSLPIRAEAITWANNALSLFLLSLSTFWLGKTFGATSRIVSAVVLLPLGVPLVFQLSTHLMADILNAAATIALTAALTQWRRLQTIGNTVLIALVVAFGLTTKPIFLFWLGISLSYLVLESLAQKRSKVKLLTLLLAVSLSLFFLLPHHLVSILKDLQFHNETLGYWRRFSGWGNHLAWFPLIISKTVPSCLLLLILSFVFLHSPKTLFKKQTQILWIPWLAATLYVSLAVVSKDERHFFFLLYLFLVGLPLTLFTEDKQSLRPRLAAPAIALTVLLVHLSWWNPSSVLKPFRLIYRLDKPCFSEVVPSLNKHSLESLGVIAATQTILADQKLRHRTPTVFIPHSSGNWNAGMFASQKPLKVSAATLRYGGWGNSGGFPIAFFLSDYVVTLEGNLEGHLVGDTEIYNQWIAHGLASSPLWKDGLTLVARLPSRMGQVAIYRRDQLPKPSSFLTMAKELREIDPANPWNFPFWMAAQDLAPKETWPTSLGNAKSLRLNPQTLSLIALAKKDPNHVALAYPNFLNVLKP